jgi:hypothetical protein
MTLLRANAALPRPEFQPAEDFRALRRILTIFIAGAVVCAGICAAMIVRDARRHRGAPRHATACTCMGRCMRYP